MHLLSINRDFKSYKHGTWQVAPPKILFDTTLLHLSTNQSSGILMSYRHDLWQVISHFRSLNPSLYHRSTSQPCRHTHSVREPAYSLHSTQWVSPWSLAACSLLQHEQILRVRDCFFSAHCHSVYRPLMWMCNEASSSLHGPS